MKEGWGVRQWRVSMEEWISTWERMRRIVENMEQMGKWCGGEENVE